MVDSIGSRLVTADRGVTRVGTATPTTATRSAVTTDAPPVAPAGSLAQQLAAAPPIDLDRVARIKLAIADGSYPILPGTIADNLIALRLKLTAEGN